jgi:hypothetical protein
MKRAALVIGMSLLVWSLTSLTRGQTKPSQLAVPATQPASAATTPTAVVATTPMKSTFRIYLLMGQSNMAGRGSPIPAEQSSDAHILSLDREGRWVIAKDPLHGRDGRTEPGVGPGMTFARAMLKADPNVTIGLVPCAVGGSPLKRWVKGGDLYAHAVARGRAAEEVGVLEGVLWHQGESDTNDEKRAATYEARLTQMLTDLRQDLRTPGLPIVVGQLGGFLSAEKYPHAQMVRDAINRVAATVPNVGYADSSGLVDKGDKLHFNAEAQREFGSRYAAAMQKLKPHAVQIP